MQERLGSGKSVFLNSLLAQLIEKYNKGILNISLIDPKRVELSRYQNADQVTEFADNTTSARAILTNAVAEIEKRYKRLEEKGFRNIAEYNLSDWCPKMPYKVIIIDEVADLLLQDKKTNKRRLDTKELSIENLIVRIAQIGRACGVHLVIATQRPSSDVITGLIKANVPSRVAFTVSSKVDSRVVLDDKGAEKLLGKGDMLLKMVGSDEIQRLQAPFISNEEVDEIVVKHKKQVETYPEPEQPKQPEPAPKTKKTNQPIVIVAVVTLLIVFVITMLASDGNFLVVMAVLLVIGIISKIIMAIYNFIQKLK